MEFSLDSMDDNGPVEYETQRSQLWIQVRDLERSNEKLVEKSFDLMCQEVIHTEAKDNINNYETCVEISSAEAQTNDDEKYCHSW